MTNTAPDTVYSAVTKYWLYYCISVFSLVAVKQHLGLIYGIIPEAECRQYRAGEQGRQHVLEKPKLAFAQRESKFAVAQPLKQLLLSPPLCCSTGGNGAVRTPAPACWCRDTLDKYKVRMFSRNLRNWSGRSLVCVLREENWTHISQRQRTRCMSTAGGEHHFTLVSSWLVMHSDMSQNDCTSYAAWKTRHLVTVWTSWLGLNNLNITVWRVEKAFKPIYPYLDNPLAIKTS